MQRIVTPTRPNWEKLVEAQGLLYHTLNGEPYWDEGAYYLFETGEIDLIEAATEALDSMCLELVGNMITERRLGELEIPEQFHGFVAASWERDDRTIYGRFDLAYDGSGPPKLLEYNADTPTSLLEAAVIQWSWMNDLLAPMSETERGMLDQFSSIHERLIEAWEGVRREMGRRVVFASMQDSLEDYMTATYLRDTATQAGLIADPLDIKQIGWHHSRGVFTDLRERAAEILFKLYPWEWMLREEFARYLPIAPTHWLEPPWKMALSNKAILPILREMFPESPYLLDASFEPIGETYVAKPVHSREGANIAIVVDGSTVAETAGSYGNGPYIYQAYHPVRSFQGRHPVLGSWIVNGQACGMGIREDDGQITGNTSRFVPHIFRTSMAMKPPIMMALPDRRDRNTWADPRHDPLWDSSLDS